MRKDAICLTPQKTMGTSDYPERCLSEIMALRAFEAGALDYLLLNYFATGSGGCPPHPWERQSPDRRFPTQ